MSAPPLKDAMRRATAVGSPEAAALQLSYVHDPGATQTRPGPDELYQLFEALRHASYFRHARRVSERLKELAKDGTAMYGDVERGLADMCLREGNIGQAEKYLRKAHRIHAELHDKVRIALDLVVAARIYLVQGESKRASYQVLRASIKVAALERTNSAPARHVDYWTLLVTTITASKIDSALAWRVGGHDALKQHRQVAQQIGRSYRPTKVAGRVVKRENTLSFWQRQRANTTKPAWGWMPFPR